MALASLLVKLKQAVRRTRAGQFAFFVVKYLPEYVIDAWEYHRNSKTFNSSGYMASRANMLELSHALEKGFSLRQPRAGFGRDKALRLQPTVTAYEARWGADVISRACKDVYLQHQVYLEDEAEGMLDNRAIRLRERIKRSEDERHVLREFLRNRASSRQFSSEAPPVEMIRRAVESALAAPSSCNRQSTVVHLYSDPGRIAQLLTLQGGAHGFADEVLVLAVVATRLAAWDSPNERHQGLVDSGMFAMNLLLALEVEGLVSCPLNFAVVNAKQRQIREAGDIPKDERLVLAVAIGLPEKEYHVARSARLPVDEVLVRHDKT